MNAYLWVQDLAISSGLDYTYVATITWGIGLTIHAAVYFLRQRKVTEVGPAEKAEKELQLH